MQSSIHNVPTELKSYRNWLVWKYEIRKGAAIDEKPTKMPYCVFTGKKCDVTDPTQLGTFQNAVSACIFNNYDGVGFVFSDNVPYSGIDLDHAYEKKPDGTYKYDDPAAEQDRQNKIYHAFDSYAEMSPSGKGLHIIVKGKMSIGGTRLKSVEVYSKDRYFTMTGNAVRESAIKDYEAELLALEAEIAPRVTFVGNGGNSMERLKSNSEIVEIAGNASNGDKFKDLWEGRWESYYESQSDADFALVDIIAYYTDNKLQVVELFRESGLGQRDKAKRDNYVGPMVDKAYDQKIPDIDFSSMLALQEQRQVTPAPLEALSAPEPDPAPTPSTGSYIGPDGRQPPHFRQDYPTGILGRVVKYIYDASPRPVYEIALMAGMAFLSGITGRAYNVSGSGLNGYFLTLAQTATGKEAAALGISKLVSAVSDEGCPAIQNYMGPGDLASGQALIRHMSENTPSCVSVLGEFGLRMHSLSSERANAADRQLLRVLLDMFNKSGNGQALMKTAYADSSKNTGLIKAPAFSLYGESVPSIFYGAINDESVNSGLMPRFNVLEYTGKRPKSNRAHSNTVVPHELIAMLKNLTLICNSHNDQDNVVNVNINDDAMAALDEIDEKCDEYYEKADKEISRNLWSRVHFKTWKLAGLLAVSDDMDLPTISLEHVQWAYSFVEECTRSILVKFDKGEIASSDEETAQMDAIQHAINDYLDLSIKNHELKGLGYNGFIRHLPMRKDGAVPSAYIFNRCKSLKVFRDARIGATNAINARIKSMIDNDVLQEISRKQMSEKYKSNAKAYAVLVEKFNQVS